MSRHDFFGYRRENGRVGVRNHVVILPLDDVSNAAAETVADTIKGTLALPHACGRPQFEEDLDLFFRTLIGTGSNPNVAACVVVGCDPEWTGRVVAGIARTRKPVAGFAIEGDGDVTTIAAASRKAKEFIQRASAQLRETCSIHELFVAVKCGESDTTSGLASCPTVGDAIDKLDPQGATTCFGETAELTGAELACASRAATKDVADRFMRLFHASEDRHKTSDLSDSLLTESNIAGGLTTIEEKAFGSLKKIGQKTKFIDVLKPAEAPAKGPGLYYMDTPLAAAECITLQAAAGFVVQLFPTGQGSAIGNAIVPVIKLTSNPRTARTMREHIDLDVSGLLRRELTVHVAGDLLIDLTLRTCSGRLTSAEALGHREFALTKLSQRA